MCLIACNRVFRQKKYSSKTKIQIIYLFAGFYYKTGGQELFSSERNCNQLKHDKSIDYNYFEYHIVMSNLVMES